MPFNDKLFLVPFIAFSLFVVDLSYAQKNNDTRSIGLTFSTLGANDIIHFETIDGASNFQGRGLISVGIIYAKSINNWLIFETGLEYSRHKINVLSSVSLGGLLIPSPPLTERLMDNYQKVILLSIPATIKAKLGKYFFINGGALLDIDFDRASSIGNQSGLGGILGIGIEYDFNNKVGVFINPLAKVHALISYSDGDHLVESAARFGVIYNL